MPRFLRRLSQHFIFSDWIHHGLCMLAACYIRFVWVTSRWDVIGDNIPRSFWNTNRPFVLAFWHGRLLMMPCCWNPSRTIRMLISQHKDGQFIAHTVAHFGIRSVTGSSSQGGQKALRAMLKTLRAGESVGITPDGPRGPCMRVVPGGVVTLARLSGVPVVPVSFSANRALVLQSWDRFLIAWPFGRGVFVWGEPISVPKNADATTLEARRKAIEQGLNLATEEADRRMGTRRDTL